MATFSPSRDRSSSAPSSICHPTRTVQWPSVGGPKKTQGHAVSQLHDSKYVPLRCQAMSPSRLRPLVRSLWGKASGVQPRQVSFPGPTRKSSASVMTPRRRARKELAAADLDRRIPEVVRAGFVAVHHCVTGVLVSDAVPEHVCVRRRGGRAYSLSSSTPVRWPE